MFTRALLVASLLVPLAGCWNNEGAGGKSVVGVVDLDEAASDLGLTQQIQTLMQDRDQKLVSELRGIQQKLQANFEAKKKEVGETPTQKQKEELQVLEIQSNQALRNLQAQAQNNLQQLRLTLVREVRQKFKDSIQEVAKKHDMKLVLTAPNDTLIYSDRVIDITDELIEALRGKSLQLTPPTEQTQAPTVGDSPAPPPSNSGGSTNGEPALP